MSSEEWNKKMLGTSDAPAIDWVVERSGDIKDLGITLLDGVLTPLDWAVEGTKKLFQKRTSGSASGGGGVLGGDSGSSSGSSGGASSSAPIMAPTIPRDVPDGDSGSSSGSASSISSATGGAP